MSRGKFPNGRITQQVASGGENLLTHDLCYILSYRWCEGGGGGGGGGVWLWGGGGGVWVWGGGGGVEGPNF